MRDTISNCKVENNRGRHLIPNSGLRIHAHIHMNTHEIKIERDREYEVEETKRQKMRELQRECWGETERDTDT